MFSDVVGSAREKRETEYYTEGDELEDWSQRNETPCGRTKCTWGPMKTKQDDCAKTPAAGTLPSR